MSDRISSQNKTKTMVSLAMLCAIAYAVMAMCKVIPPIAGFLSLDLKDTIIAIGGFIFGPLAALLVSIVVSVLEFLTVSDTGPIGLIMNIIATAAFVCPATFLYKRRRNLSSAVIGLITGVICLTTVMILWNYLITPIYLKLPRAAVVDMIVPILLPFNLIKGFMNAALTMLLYTPIVGALRKAHLVPSHGEVSNKPRGKFHWGPVMLSLLVLATAVLFALVMMDII
ncbi:MAG: ECF transporter S component [Pseudoflavonifractor sp.]